MRLSLKSTSLLTYIKWNWVKFYIDSQYAHWNSSLVHTGLCWTLYLFNLNVWDTQIHSQIWTYQAGLFQSQRYFSRIDLLYRLYLFLSLFQVLSVSYPPSMSPRFHRVSCTLPRYHKARRCRSHRTVRQVCVRNNQPLLFLNHSLWCILHFLVTLENFGKKLLEWTHSWENCGLFGRKWTLFALVWGCVKDCCNLVSLLFTFFDLLFEIILNICVSMWTHPLSPLDKKNYI